MGDMVRQRIVQRREIRGMTGGEGGRGDEKERSLP